MTVSCIHRLQRFLQKANPLPIPAAGFLLGLILWILLASADSVTELIPLPPRRAFAAAVSCELPIVGAIALAGLTRLPQLPGIPLFIRSLGWGYGSLQMYASMGSSFHYFQYVLGNGFTILPLCYLVKTATECAKGSEPLHGLRLYDYLCRCLFYCGLVLLTLPLKLYGG